MAEKYLNEGCIFKCSLCPTVKLKPKETRNRTIKFEGKTALTTETQMILVTPGVCPNLPPSNGAPNCIPVSRLISGNWTKYSKHTAKEKHLLIESSVFKCMLGGDITVEKKDVKKIVKDNYSPQTLTVFGIKDTGTAKKTENKLPESSNQHSKASKSSIDTQYAVQSSKDESEKKEQEKIAIEDLYCPYDSAKEKCKSCKYAESDSEHMVSAKREGSSKLPSAVLRENYEKDYEMLALTRKKYKKSFATLKEEYEMFNRINCGNAAHHILSTKDVFEQDKLKFVLKMANFYEFDVNEAYNCIILPGINAFEERNKTEFQARFREMTEYEKRKLKYYAMRETGRQWHGGGHGQDYENEHNISCYATEVTDLLYSYMKKETKQHCRIDETYYEKDRERFVRIVHRVINLVRDKLISFEANSKNSVPFYVSADAYSYAFNASNIRLLVFRKMKDGLEVYKYTLSRKNGKTYPEERAVKHFSIKDIMSKLSLVVFCEQIDIAYIDMSQGKVDIPFSITHIIYVNMNGIAILDYFNANISAVEAEVSDFPAGDKDVMKSRRKEVKGH